MHREEFEQIVQAERDKHRAYEHHINVCTALGCVAYGSEKVVDALEAEVKERGLEHKCKITGVGCLGLCGSGPIMKTEPDNQFYQSVKPSDSADIIDHLGKEPVKRIHLPQNSPFFIGQQRVVLSNAGKIDPEEIESALAFGAYRALFQAATEMTPTEVLREVTASGLRGRGGAGYPTGLKWSTVAKMDDTIKYIVCNGDEGDPGAFMDRSIMESDPHRILEGMAIAAYAVGATEGYIYVRAEYGLGIQRLKKAIRQAEKMGFLGNNIFDSPFSFNVQLRLGAGAFVCGEETALIASIEGQRGNPRPRPPYPAMSGLWGHSTLINNVETFANIAPIILNGSEWFAGIGTKKSAGTKVFALSGKVNRVGLIEVPMGITLRQIIEGIGGGIPDGRAFKAVQTGGPSGGCIPQEHLDTPVDYESLRELGSIMGSGGMVIMDDTSSMVSVARYFMEFCMDESCGKCIPCRVGTAQMHELLTRFVDKEATEADLELLEELCDMVSQTSLCGLGQSAPNPVMSTLRYFRDEYLQCIAPAQEPA
ncbi:MAG: NADH-quinone oxidoreductase subunit NuoF [Anaerolineae bacterium]|nr:NADH-quinone oxidoreductase subunit NuoF [Anaerolineae bacterium]